MNASSEVWKVRSVGAGDAHARCQAVCEEGGAEGGRCAAAASIDASVGRGARTVRRFRFISILRKVSGWRTPDPPSAACSTHVSAGAGFAWRACFSCRH